jgi:hypothetical protein
MWSSDREQRTNPIKRRRKMFKKSLFALLLVVALFTVVGSGVASASGSVGCIQSSDSCPSFNASTLAAPSSNYLSGYFQSIGATTSKPEG